MPATIVGQVAEWRNNGKLMAPIYTCPRLFEFIAHHSQAQTASQ
jgi:hypothetical protein